MPVRQMREEPVDEPEVTPAPVERLSRRERAEREAAAAAGAGEGTGVAVADAPAIAAPAASPAPAPRPAPRPRRSTPAARTTPGADPLPDYGDLVRGELRRQSFTIPGVVQDGVIALQDQLAGNYPQAFLFRALVVLQLQQGGPDGLVQRMAQYMVWLGEQGGNTNAEPIIARLHNGTVDAIERANGEMNPGRSGARRYKSSIVASLLWQQLQRVESDLDGLAAELQRFAIAEQVARMTS
jgi:hypothetical protein